MTAQLQSLIDKSDSVELVRDKVATILLEESAKQQEYANAAGKEPAQWALRIFTERANPWENFKQESDEPQTPIVAIWFENQNFEKPGSNVISAQRATVTLHVDCYGFGFSKSTDDGHLSGDEVAVREAHRAARLVRNILMSGYYVYLGFPQGVALAEDEEQLVSGRWVSALTAFQPAQQDRPVDRVAAIRVDLEVQLYEFGPEYAGQTLEQFNTTFARGESGEWFSMINNVPAP